MSEATQITVPESEVNPQDSYLTDGALSLQKALKEAGRASTARDDILTAEQVVRLGLESVASIAAYAVCEDIRGIEGKAANDMIAARVSQMIVALIGCKDRAARDAWSDASRMARHKRFENAETPEEFLAVIDGVEPKIASRSKLRAFMRDPRERRVTTLANAIVAETTARDECRDDKEILEAETMAAEKIRGRQEVSELKALKKAISGAKSLGDLERLIVA